MIYTQLVIVGDIGMSQRAIMQYYDVRCADQVPIEIPHHRTIWKYHPLLTAGVAMTSLVLWLSRCLMDLA